MAGTWPRKPSSLVIAASQNGRTGRSSEIQTAAQDFGTEGAVKIDTSVAAVSVSIYTHKRWLWTIFQGESEHYGIIV